MGIFDSHDEDLGIKYTYSAMQIVKDIGDFVRVKRINPPELHKSVYNELRFLFTLATHKSSNDRPSLETLVAYDLVGHTIEVLDNKKYGETEINNLILDMFKLYETLNPDNPTEIKTVEPYERLKNFFNILALESLERRHIFFSNRIPSEYSLDYYNKKRA